MLDRLGVAGEIDWSRASLDAQGVPAPGTKRHLVIDRLGTPLAFCLTGANTNDSTAFEALLDAIPSVRQWRGRPRKRPVKLHAEKGYDFPK